MTANQELPFTSLVNSLPATIPFTGPETIERRLGRTFKARIGANESAFGMSPNAAEAVAAECARGSWYGDPECFELREQLAAHHGVAKEEICVAAGIDEILGLVVRLVCTPGTPIVTSDGAYPTFNYHIAGFGGRRIAVPYNDDFEDPDALIQAAREYNAPLVYISNPDNPMGTWLAARTISRFIAELPETTLIILDEAYADFAPSDSIPAIDTSDPRVLRMRTFSKAHGLAGLRIGYVIANRAVIVALGKIRNHFGVNRLAQVAAMASLADSNFAKHVRASVNEGRADYMRMAEIWGLRPLPSATNFVTIDVGGAERAVSVLKALERHGIFIRMPGVAPLNRCIRLSIGRPEERALLEETMPQVLAEV